MYRKVIGSVVINGEPFCNIISDSFNKKEWWDSHKHILKDATTPVFIEKENCLQIICPKLNIVIY